MRRRTNNQADHYWCTLFVCGLCAAYQPTLGYMVLAKLTACAPGRQASTLVIALAKFSASNVLQSPSYLPGLPITTKNQQNNATTTFLEFSHTRRQVRS